MMLSDSGIMDAMTMCDIRINPFPANSRLQPASIDLVFDNDGYPTKDVGPGEFVLASTLETVTLSGRVAGMVAGKSSLARLGLMVECAGFIDPGFCGQITLELKNVSAENIVIRDTQPICQIVFFRLDQEAQRPYGSAGLNSHYQNQEGVTHSHLAEDEQAIGRALRNRRRVEMDR